jgi:arginyl-tRNA synthetase
VEIPILQFVHIVEGGGRKGMSKRRGDFVTLDELIEGIGVDATRWFMISRSQDSTIDLDLELARRQDPENPVYYVQYAHARIASILRRAGEDDVAAALAAAPAGLELHPSERELIRRLLSFPGEMREAAERRAPHRVATFALELGQAFAAFYRDAPVLNAEDAALRTFRLQLCVVAQRTLATSLALLGVSAPEQM